MILDGHQQHLLHGVKMHGQIHGTAAAPAFQALGFAALAIVCFQAILLLVARSSKQGHLCGLRGSPQGLCLCNGPAFIHLGKDLMI